MNTTTTPHRVQRRSVRERNEETRMYELLIATFAALTVFVPTFIGIRARTNADWKHSA
jgi:hypothetical protein